MQKSFVSDALIRMKTFEPLKLVCFTLFITLCLAKIKNKIL